MGEWNDDQWLWNFRMSWQTFIELCQWLTPVLRHHDTRMQCALTIEKRVAIAVWKLATPDSYRSVGQQFGVGKATVGAVLMEVVRALNALLLKRVVRVGDLDAAVEGFAAMGFPNCFGALDGIPLPIRAPDHSGGRYINRKGYHFVVLQSMVDSCGHFQDIYVGWPGSTHDACVFRNSGLCCRPQAETYIPQREIPLGDTTTVPLCLVGDAAYHLQPWLMRPYTGHFTDSQERYNARHNHAQQVVERAFERLLALPPGTPRPGPPKHPSGCGGLLHTPQPVGKQGGGLRAGLGTGGRNSLPPAIRRSELPAPPGQGLGPGGPKGVL
ncbi:patatin-like phospholipase domain-containing protein 4 isoform X3 [Carettochelys insculpta]|uniref:patatin-like phospholipase domain-containing protein 4 isoform X3 n=1 Tax=Carettochelys insculpta TaxID=44489 RepID=UPI003EBB6D69